MIESLIATARNDPETMRLLQEESVGSEGVTDEQVREAALAPINPLMSLLDRYQDLDMAMAFVLELQEANKKTQKKGAPTKSNERDEEYEAEAVVVDTIHGWKGLEASHMYVPMPANVFPHKKTDDLDSERRLAYVAITRGRDSVKILCPQKTHMGKEGGVSRFVGEACVKLELPPPKAPEEGTEVSSSFWSELEAEFKDELELDSITRKAKDVGKFVATLFDK